MKLAVGLWLVAGCAFSGSAPADAVGDELVWRQTTEADFAAGTSVDAFVSRRGTIEPMLYGSRFKLFGVAGALLQSPLADFATLSGATDTIIDGIGVIRAPRWIQNAGPGAPFTVWGSGLLVVRNDFAYEALVTCTGIGFIEVGSQRLTCGQRDVPVDTNGAVPLRIAWSDSNTAATEFRVSLRRINSNDEYRPLWDLAQRWDASTAIGIQRIAWNGASGADFAMQRLANEPAGGHYPTQPPLFNLDPNSWAMTSGGQLWIEETGMHRVSLQSSEARKFWLDGVLIEDGAVQQATHELPLDRGWHDLLVEHSAAQQQASLTLRLDDRDLAADEFRPASSGRQQLAWLTERLNDASAQVDFPVPNDARVKLVAGWGLAMNPTRITLRQGSVTLEYNAVSVGGGATISGGDQPNQGSWTLTRNTDSNAVNYFTMHYQTQNLELVANDATYTSVIHDFGQAVQVTAATATTSIPAPFKGTTTATIAVTARICEAACTSEPFMPIAMLVGQRGQFAQYSARFQSDNFAAPSVEQVELRAIPAP